MVFLTGFREDQGIPIHEASWEVTAREKAGKIVNRPILTHFPRGDLSIFLFKLPEAALKTNA